MYTSEYRYCEFEVNPFLCFHMCKSKYDAAAEWLACRLLDLQVAGSNPGGDTFQRVITLSKLFTQIYSGQLSLSSFRGR